MVGNLAALGAGELHAIGLTGDEGDAYDLRRDLVCLEQIIAALPTLRAAAGAPVCVTRGPAGMVVADDEITVVSGVRVDGPVDPTGRATAPQPGPCWPSRPEQPCPKPLCWATSWRRSRCSNWPQRARPGRSNSFHDWHFGSHSRERLGILDTARRFT